MRDKTPKVIRGSGYLGRNRNNPAVLQARVDRTFDRDKAFANALRRVRAAKVKVP